MADLGFRAPKCQIHQLVYELYNLTKKGIRIVEGGNS